MRRILALFLPLLLLMSACSGGTTDPSSSGSATTPSANAEALASVKVEDQGAGKPPTVTFDKPLAITAQSIRVVKEGTGAEVKAGQTVSLRQIIFNAEDGVTHGNNFADPAGQPTVFDDTLKTGNATVYNTFVGAKIGSYVAFANPGTPAVAGTTAAPSQAAQPAVLSVFLIESAKDTPAPAKLMSADDVAALEKAGKLPVATFDAKGVPSITIPKNDPPAGLAVQVLTEGTGEVLKDSDSISALYSGWDWKESTKFDSAFDRGAPVTFALKEVIAGWTLGLTGQKVGSTVLLSIPSTLAYGDPAPASKPSGALVFVVKIEAKK